MTPQAKLAACRKVLETTKAHNQKLREENEKLREELRTAVIDASEFSRRMIELRGDNDLLRDRLHRANLFSARAKNEAVLERRDGWAKVIDIPPRNEANPFHPRPTLCVDQVAGIVFYATDEHDPFGRSVYRQR